MALRPAPPAHARREHLDAYVLPRAPAGAECRDSESDGVERGEGAQVCVGEARLGEPEEAVEEIERERDDDVGCRAGFVESGLHYKWAISFRDAMPCGCLRRAG